MICNTRDPPDVFQVVPEPKTMKGTDSDLLRRTGTYRLTSRTKYQIEWRQICVRGKYRTTDLPRYRVFSALGTVGMGAGTLGTGFSWHSILDFLLFGTSRNKADCLPRHTLLSTGVE